MLLCCDRALLYNDLLMLVCCALEACSTLEPQVYEYDRQDERAAKSNNTFQGHSIS